MEQVRDKRTTDLAEACAGMSPEERSEFLARECAGDDELRQTLESMTGGQTDSEQTQVFTNDYESVLPDRYRLIRMLGRGGMAEVFLAEDKLLNRNVAIKFLNSEFRKNPERMGRFLREARAASALNHPNIIVIHDICEKDSVQYIVSEYVTGETLSSRISRGRLPVDEAVSIAIQVASALSASHQAGIVHRDLKPDNVMVRKDGTVKVLDFGLAKETAGDGGEEPDPNARTLDKLSTSPGLILGTPQYMSPEQARGVVLDMRTDIFSLGIILFEMVTGRPPFTGGSLADTIAAIVSKEPRRLEEFLDDPPVSLIRIVQKALRKDRDERYGSVDHMLSDLRDFRDEINGQEFSRAGTAGTQARTTRHNTVRTIAANFGGWEKTAAIGAGAVLVAAAIWWLVSGAGTGGPAAVGAMRTIDVASWSSGTGELVFSAAFSPSAEMVAYAASKTGANEIWVQPVGGGEVIQVTKEGHTNLYPVWSPTGREIAFLSRRGQSLGIWRTAFTGGEQTLILAGTKGSAKPVYWAPSGKIYFQEGGDLWSVDERSGERAQITDLASRRLPARAIEISHDESKAAFSTKDGDVWRLMVLDLPAGEPHELARTKDQIDYLAWRPGGDRVIYSSSVDGAFQLFEADVRGGEPVRVSNGNLDFFVQDVSGDGSKVLYGSMVETSDLWAVGTQDQAVSPMANDVSSEFWPDVSPDGRSIAFQAVKQAGRAYVGSIFVKADGGTPRQVSPTGFSPVWSHDGKWIAFFRRSDVGIEAWRVRPTGDDPLKLVDSGIQTPGYSSAPYLRVGTNHMSWSPDNNFVAYCAATDGLSDVWTIGVDGQTRSNLTQNRDRAEHFCCPFWARGGQGIVFTSETRMGSPAKSIFRVWLFAPVTGERKMLHETSERPRVLGSSEDGKGITVAEKAEPDGPLLISPSTRIYSISLETGEKTKLNTLVDAYTENIHLSRDGKMIAFVSRRDDKTALWMVEAGGAAPRKLLEENDPKVLISSLAWSPDNRSIIFGKQTRTSLLSLLTN